MKTAAEVENLVTDWKSQGIMYADMCVKLAEACMGWAYVFGARGDYCEPVNRRNRYRDDHPTIKTKCKNFNGKDSSGCSGCTWYPGGRTRTYDCRGFTYWVIKKVTGVEIMGAGATSQWNNNDNWSEKGEISNMPNVVCCVFKRVGNTMEHTGLHVGNGKIIHCSGTVKTGKTTDKGWTHYAIPACLSGQPTISGSVPVKSTNLQKGSKGDAVVDLQKTLMKLGYSLPKYGADGDFGTETKNAVIQFQKDHDLTADGIVGANTKAALAAADNQQAIKKLFTVTIPDLDQITAEALIKTYTGAVMVEKS